LTWVQSGAYAGYHFDEGRTKRQPQDRQGPGPDDPADDSARGRPSHRV